MSWECGRLLDRAPAFSAEEGLRQWRRESRRHGQPGLGFSGTRHGHLLVFCGNQYQDVYSTYEHGSVHLALKTRMVRQENPLPSPGWPTATCRVPSTHTGKQGPSHSVSTIGTKL